MAGEPNKPCYRVRDWNRVYEKAQTRKLAALTWISIPNKLDSGGYRKLTRRPNAVREYCGWILLVQVASRMPTRGILATPEGPLDAEDLADRTGFPKECFEAAIDMALQPKINWLDTVDFEQVVARWERAGSALADDGHNPTRPDPTRPDVTEQDVTRPDTTEPASASASDCAQNSEVGSDRRNDRRKFQQVFAMRILTALGIHTDTGGRQVETMFRNALRIVDLPDSERITNELVDRARSKVAAGMRSPIKAWQAEFNKLYHPKPRRMTNG